MTPIASVELDVMPLLEQCNMSLGTGYAAIDLTNAFYLVPAHKDHQKKLERPVSLQFYIKNILTLQFFVTT